MSDLVCPDCGGKIKLHQGNCKHCGAELVWKEKKVTNKIRETIKNNSLIHRLMTFSWLYLTIIGGLIEFSLGTNFFIKGFLILSIPITVAGIIFLIKDFEVTREGIKEFFWNFVLLVIFAIIFVGFREGDITIEKILLILVILIKRLKRPLIILGVLGCIYALVRFIKRAWNRK